MRNLNICIAGLGNVGANLINTIVDNNSFVTSKASISFDIIGISAKNRNKKRICNIDSYEWFDDSMELVNTKGCDVIIELIGEEKGISFSLVKKALENNINILQDDDLKPKPPPKLAPRGIRSFTVCRQYDETGVSGEGVIIEGIVLASGHCIIHWLFPPPRGGIAIFDSLEDFLKVHVKPHPENKTLITFEDGEQKEY